MSVGTDPRYGRLADRVLSAWSVPASGRVDVKRAILAQWQCEQPANAWPPRLNNPAFVTLGALQSWGLTLGATCGKQYPSFCLALFPTPEAGADAYAGGVLRGSRYAGALRAARAGDGLGMLRAITSAGWGTRFTCARSAYASLGGKVTAVTGGTTPNATLATSLTPEAMQREILDLLRSLGISTDPDHVINAPEEDRIHIADDHLFGEFTLQGKTVSQLLGVAESRQASPGAQAQNAIGDALNAFLAGLGQLGFNIAMVAFAIVLLLIGIYVLATAEDSPLPKVPTVPIPV